MPRSGHWLLGLVLLFLPFFAGALELTDLPGEPAATLRLADLGGQVHDLAEPRGRVVLVNIGASWCQPCIREIPRLRDLAGQFQDRPVTLLAVNSGEPLSTVNRAVKRHGIDLKVLVDPSAEQTGAWGVMGLPTSYPGGLERPHADASAGTTCRR